MFWLLALPLLSLASGPLVIQDAGEWPHYDPKTQFTSPNGLLELLEQWDVVEVMKLTGHGEGLDEVRRIQVFGEEGIRTATEGEKLRLKKAGKSFIDVTDHPRLGELNLARIRTDSLPGSSLGFDHVAPKESVKAMISEIDDAHLRKDIAKLSSFWNRSYRSPWGLASSNWVHDTVRDLLNSTAHAAIKTSVRKFSHKFIQNSIIATVETSSDDVKPKDQEVIIMGAHQDSLNYRLPFYRAPGADDDGSGTVTILQVLRSLMEQQFVPPSGVRLEFHWYAAEEGGLLGSQDIAASYEKEGVDVRAMLQMDMTAFLKNDTEPIVGVFGDQVDKNLTTFTTKLVDAYLPIGWNMTGCGASCGSDHMSWHKAGYRSAFVTEGLYSDFDPFIHTAYDNLEADGQYSFEHMLHFVKLGIAWITELSVLPSSSG